MATCTTAAGPGLRQICDDLVDRGGWPVEQELSELCMYVGSRLGGVQGGKRLGAAVLHERRITSIGGAKQSSAL